MKLADKILSGDVAAAARLMTDIENAAPDAIEELKGLYPYTGKAYIVGVTGAPGVGKSTLADALISTFRRQNMTIRVIAVDPTSPFSGGAILGDRVRMQRHSLDNDVFIRSLATRGCEGGLAGATMSLIHVMDAMGKDIILVETVGTGQNEMDITQVADTAIVILMPGMGDEIQLMKAGIVEAADIFTINKADREGAENLRHQLEVMIKMKSYPPDEWQPSIVLTEAIHDKGTEELAETIFKHKEYLIASGVLKRRRQQRAKLELTEAIESSLKDYIYRQISQDINFEKLVDDLVERRTNPHSAAMEIINQFRGREWTLP